MKSVEKLIIELGELSHRSHYYCDEDSWYSCPKAPEGCANEYVGTDCNCGADEHNAKADELVKAALKENEWSNKMEEIFNTAAIIDGNTRLSYPNILK